MKRYFKFIDTFFIFTLVFCLFTFILFPFLRVFSSTFYSGGKFTLEGFTFLKTQSKLLYNSIFVAFFTTIITTVVSVSIGIFCFSIRKSFKKIISFILMITMISPPFVSSLAYIRLFGRRGFITHDIFKLSIDAYGSFGIILMQSIGLISLSGLMIISALNSIDKEQINSARSLGAKTNNLILDIILPQLLPSIKVVAILSFIRSIADFSTPLIIGGAFETLASKSYNVFISDGNIVQAGAMNIMLCVPVVLTFIFYVKNSKIISNTNFGANTSEVNIEKRGFVFSFITLTAIVFLILLFLQYSSVILSAFTDYSKGKLYFTFEHFVDIKDHIDKTVFRSIYYSLISAFFGSLIGLLLQYYIHIRNVKFLKIFEFIATMPYMLPGTFFGIGYILAFNNYPIYITGTALIVILNVTFKQLPFSTKIFNSSLETIDKNQILSAKDLGANEFFIFKDVVLSHTRNDFVISMINGFNSTMTTVGSIIFIVYPAQKVLTLVMFDVINSGKYNTASVLALLIILICLSFSLLFMLINYILGKLGDRYVLRSKKFM
ncbi:ABC transporter, permease protein [Parvimonas sp. KA00067]|uniref:ABC transporter permease n=1 Tax=Parvimonas sp. KA00067 TaxID=1588755 RepID=UPI00079861CD|nr:iron ABC transporter permease [Parvimonas sp. KA00067]KXB67793.1 ABC transporter, permease protein [Parvimonas sp. KA00067]